MKPIDRQTWQQWRHCVESARREGRSLPEVLNARQMLLTHQRRQAIRAYALREAAKLLEGATAAQVISEYGGRNNTALDMQRGVVAWLRNRADREEESNEQ